MEIWKDIVGYEGYYQVSTSGNVVSLKSGRGKRKKPRLLKPEVEKKGYLRVGLYRQNDYKHYMVHRLVATAFIPNPNNLPFINHKDEDKKNNVVSNLEWCTNDYNENYGTRNLRSGNSRKKPILVFDKKTDWLIAEYASLKEAAVAYGMNDSFLAKLCRGREPIKREFLKSLRFEFKYDKDYKIRFCKRSKK